MIPSRLSPTHSQSLAAQEPTLPASGHAGTAAGPLQPPPHLPVPRRTAQAGPSAPTRLRGVLPPGPGTAGVSPTRPVRQAAPSANPAAAMTLARAEEIANDTGYGQLLALASRHFDDLLKYTLETYAAAQVCHTRCLDSDDETHQASAQTLAIKAALLNGLYLMRRHHKEWNLAVPVISVKTLKNVLPLFHHAVGLCKEQSEAVRFPIEGLQPALEHLQKQAAQSQQCLEAAPASDAGQLAACRELALLAQQLQGVLAHGPDARQTEPAPGDPAAATPASAWQRSFKSVLTESAPVRPATVTPPAQRQAPPNPRASRDHQPAMPRMETLQLKGRPTSASKPKPRHPGAADRRAAQPTRPTTQPPAAHLRAPQRTAETGRVVTAEHPAEAATSAAAEAATRLRQEQLARLQGVLAPLQEEATRLHGIAQACASGPTSADPPWARQALEFAAWQRAAQADDACAKALIAHVKELGFGPRDPAVHGLRRKFNTASRGALECATQAAESALAVFLQAWEAAQGQAGPKRAGLAAQGRELQQQWLEAPLRPLMPALSARMAVFDACEALSDVRARDLDAGGRAATHEAAELLCQATDDARHASEGAKGELRNRLGTLHASCKNLRDELLCKTVRLEFEAADAAHAEASDRLEPLLQRSRETVIGSDLLLPVDPMPAAGPGAPGAQTPPAHGATDMPKPDQDLVNTARDVTSGLRAQREKAIQLPPDAPEQAAHDQQAVLGVLRQAEMSAECAVATLTSFHELKGVLAPTPLDERPTLMRRHARAARDRSQDLQKILLALEDMPDRIKDAGVEALVARSCALLCHDLRHAQTVLAALETQAKLLDARKSADHACGRITQGNRATPGPDVDGSTHQAIQTWAEGAMQSIEKVLWDEQGRRETQAWAQEKGRLDKVGDGLLLRIDCDSALIRVKYFLQALAVAAPNPDAAPLSRPDLVNDLVQQCIKFSKTLVQVNDRLQAHAASSSHGTDYAAQIGMNKEVHEQLRTRQRQLLVTLAGLRAQAPADPAAGSSQAPAGPPEADASSRASASGRRRHRGRS